MMAAMNEAQETVGVELAALLDAGDDAIVTLVAGETRLAAHRAVLEARSPVFKSMFGQNALEARNTEIEVTNVEGPVLRQVLAYCYTLQAPQLPSMAPQLLAAAATYGLSGLKDACEQQVVGQLAVETAAALGVLAVRHSCSSLKQAAVTLIKGHTDEVMKTPGWKDAEDIHPHDVLKLFHLILESPAESRTPATAEGSPTTSTDSQLHSSRSQSPATDAAAAAPPTASHCTVPPDNTTILHKQTSAAATPGTQGQPHSGHGSRAPATAAAPTAPRHAAPPDDAAVSRFRSLSQQERNRRLIRAADKGAVPELRALLAAGADVGERDERGCTALHYAAEGGHEEAARRLVEAGAEVDAREIGQCTPLHLAAVWGHAAVVRLLLAASADPNARDQSGWTPLHWAAYHGRAEAAAALLQGGADRAARDDRGRTPLDVARQSNNQQLIQLLTQ